MPRIITFLVGALNVVGMFMIVQYTSMGIYSIVITTTEITAITSLIMTAIILCGIGFLIYFIFVFSAKERKYILGMVKHKVSANK